MWTTTPLVLVSLIAFAPGVSAALLRHTGQHETVPRRGSVHSMWLGDDLPEESSQLSPSPNFNLHAKADLNASDEHVVLLGPMDSGTHLLDWMLEKNFPREYPRACQGSPRGCKWVWKHSLGVDGIVNVLKSTTAENLKNTVVLAIVRSPFALLAGWRKDPWDMQMCVKRPYSRMNRPCSASLGATSPDDHVGLSTRKVPKLDFHSTVEVVEQYYEQYASLQKSGLFKKVLVLRYEDLLLAPTGMMARLSVELGWHQPTQIRIAKSGVKGATWADTGRKQAIEYLRKRAYMDGVSKEGLRAICSVLSNISHATLDTVRVSQAEGADGDVSLEPGYGSECNSTEFTVAWPHTQKPWWKHVFR